MRTSSHSRVGVTSSRRKGGVVAFLLALSLTFPLVPSALAADTYPPDEDSRVGSAQPVITGYRIQDLKTWTPEGDPYSKHLRASVPLQERIARNPDTQVKPELDGKAQIMLMQGDYGNAFFDATTHNNTFTDHAMNFWQYVDYWAPWHGGASFGVPKGLYDPENSLWTNRGFEFGILSIPTPEYTNAAHRNGVKSIAVLYFDPSFRPGLTLNEIFDKDDSDAYVVAKKLVEMAKYYGFDGYFLNEEEHGDRRDEFKPFMSYLTSQGLYTQWYDTNSSFNASKAQWLRDAQYPRIHESVFVNYGNDGRSMHDWAVKNGYDPHAEVFAGIEANQTGFDGRRHSGVRDIRAGYSSDDNHSPLTSIALFDPSNFYQRGLDDQIEELTGRKSPQRPFMQQQPYQWMVAQRERMYFSGMKQDVTRTGEEAANPDVAIDSPGRWMGVADFTPARSVIQGDSFHTHFSTGKGMASYTDGAITNTSAWTDMGAQSILPSWQWWITSKGEVTLGADFDYGEEPRVDIRGESIASPFVPQGAWQGGNSLVLHGSAGMPQTIRLFKTDLGVSSQSTATVTWKRSVGNGELKLGLVFADAPEVVEELALQADGGNEWTSSTVDLAPYAGRRIATIGFVVRGAQGEQLQINVGQVSLGSAGAKPATPSGLRVDEITSDGELNVSWDRADFSEVDSYRLEALDSHGRVHHLADAYADTRYVKNVGIDGDFTVRLRAIGKDGSSSEPADLPVSRLHLPGSVTIDTAKDSTGLHVHAAEAGKVSVHWTPPASGAPKGYKVRIETLFAGADNPYRGHAEIVVPADATSATLQAPPEGLPFRASVEPLGEETVGALSVRGRYHDHFARPMGTEDVVVDQGRTFHLNNPATTDWRRIDSTGDQTWTATRGKNNRSDWGNDDENGQLGRPRRVDNTFSFVIGDYAGNTSEVFGVTRKGENLEVVDAAAPEVWATPWQDQDVPAGEKITAITVSARDNVSKASVAVRLRDAARPQDPPTEDLQGLTFDPAKNSVTGSPRWDGLRRLEVTATDEAGNAATFTLDIKGHGASPNPDPKPNPDPQPNPDPKPNPDPQPRPDPQPQHLVLELSRDSAAPGESVVMTASGATAGQDVEFTIHSDPLRLGSVKASSDGQAKLTWVVPENFPAGTHEVIATTSKSRATQSLVIRSDGTGQKAPRDGSGSTEGSTKGNLAATGADLATVLGAAGTLGLVGIVGGVLVRTRRLQRKVGSSK